MASHSSRQRMTEISRRKVIRLQKPSCSRSWHRNIVDCRRRRDSTKRGHCVGQGNLVTQAREKPQAFRWFKARRDGGENSQKTGTDKPCRNITVARDSRSTMDRVLNAPRRGKTQETPDTCSSLATNSRKPRQTRNQAVQVTVLLRRHCQHKLKVEFHSTRILKLSDPEFQLRSSSRTKRAAEPKTLDVSFQAEQPRGEGSQMDNQSLTVDGVMIAGTEDPAEYFDGHTDVAGPSYLMELRLTRRWRLNGKNSTDSQTPGCTRQWIALLLRERSALRHAGGSDHRKDGIRARLVAREFKGDETMYDVFAPSTTPSTGRIIDNLILKKWHFHVNEHEECDGDPPAEWLDQQAAVENSTSVLWRLRKNAWSETRRNTLGRPHCRTP